MSLDIGEILLAGLEEANFKLPDPELLQFYRDLEKDHLWLDEEVSYETCSHTIKWLLAADRKQTDDPIYVHIMSGGGELDIMFAIYDILKNMRRPIVTINEGRCHSAAIVIYLAGKTRLMRENACFICHEGSAGLGGSYKETKQAGIEYEKSVNRMRETIVKETLISLEELQKQFDSVSDFYIRKEEALKYGFITQNITFIYKITNLVNKKVYIGQTINHKQRFEAHRYLANENSSRYNHPLYSEIREYGLDVFSFEILQAVNKEDGDRVEKELISELNCKAPNGYNQTNGGQSKELTPGATVPHSVGLEDIDDIRRRMSYCVESSNEIHEDYSSVSRSEFYAICYGVHHKDLDSMEYLTKEVLDYHRKYSLARRTLSSLDILDIRVNQAEGEEKEGVWKRYVSKCSRRSFNRYWSGENSPEITADKIKYFEV